MEQRQVMGEWNGIQNGKGQCLACGRHSEMFRLSSTPSPGVYGGLRSLGIPTASMQYSPCMSTFENFSRGRVFDFTRFC